MGDEHFFVTSSATDFKLSGPGSPPPGYPGAPDPDTYSRLPFASTYPERKQAFVDFVLRNPGADTIKGFFYELIRINENSGPVYEGAINAAMEYIDSRKDCADFVLTGILRMYIQLAGRNLMTPGLLEKARETILNFKYWPDEPGDDSMCTWTENHQIIFSVNEYLAGQIFPGETFRNSGHSGLEKMERARPRILKWLEMRYFTGFSEWLSNVYYDEDLPPLLNLIDFCEDEFLSVRAAMVTDLLLFDIASNHFHGQFVSTHGRTYTREKKSALVESTTDTVKLLFGMGVFSNVDNMSAAVLALSEKYRLPEAIVKAASERYPGGFVNRQRVSIRFAEASKWGFGGLSAWSGMGLLLFGGYTHPRSINKFVHLLDSFGWWHNAFFNEVLPFRPLISIGKYTGLTNLIALLFRKDLSRNTLDEANLYTWKTPEAMLSTAQDYHKARGGDQHHIWQASLGPEAVCFTTHPGGYGDTAPNAYWHGSGFLPRAAQIENVSIIVYRTPGAPTILLSQTLKFTHAWLPGDKFDQVVESGAWVMARKDKGYLALYSRNPRRWQKEGDNAHKEIIAHGRRNIWICEMGRETEYGSFDAFVEKISRSRLKFRGLNVVYDSPSQGRLRFGWRGRLTRNGEKQPLKDYPRYDNPACRAGFGDSEISIRKSGHSLILDFEKGIRSFDQ